MRKVLAGVLAVALGLSVMGVSQQVVETGSFFFDLDGEAGLEEFTFTELEDGNLEMKSNFQALSEQLIFDFGTDRLFEQTVILTPDLDLVSYEVNSETDRGSFSGTVSVNNGEAVIQTTSTDIDGNSEDQERTIFLEDEVVTTGIAASQFLLMQRYINQNLDLPLEEDVFVIAFDPTDVIEPLVELEFRRLTDVIVEDVRTRAQFVANRVQISQDQFVAELISCAVDDVAGICDEIGSFLGFISSTATLAGVELGNAPGNGGAVVLAIADGSFAQQSGLLVDDVITEINGSRVIDARDLRGDIRFNNPNLPVTLTVDRGGEIIQFDVQLSGSFLQVFRFDIFEGGFSILGEA